MAGPISADTTVSGDSTNFINKLLQLKELSGDISEIYKRANKFNNKLVSLQSDFSNNIQNFSTILSGISQSYLIYKKLGRKIENLEKLNVLMDSYIQCIQIPEELVDSVGNDVIDNNYLLKHTYFLAKLDLCNQIQHENYPSLIRARIKLKQLLDLANKRIYHHLRYIMEEGFKSQNFHNLLDNKYLYDHLFKYSTLTNDLRKGYSEMLKTSYFNSLDDNLRVLGNFNMCNTYLAPKAKTNAKSSFKLVKYLNKIFITEFRDYLLSDCDWKKLFAAEQSRGTNNAPENLFNQFITKIISYSNKELSMASKLFDICDEDFGINYQILSDYTEIRQVLVPTLEKFMGKCEIYLDKSEDIVGHLLILTFIVDTISYFETNGYTQYQEIMSNVKLMFTAKVQNIISNVINEMVEYNRISVKNSKDYLKSVANTPDWNIELTATLIVTCMRVIHCYNFDDIIKLFNDLIETTLNAIISLSALQESRVKEDIYVINQLASLISALDSKSCRAIVERLDKLYQETCCRHINSQIKLMFKPIIEITSDANIDKFMSLSNEFITSHKNILYNVDKACKQYFHSKVTHTTILQHARNSVINIWNEYLVKLEKFKEINPSSGADKLYNMSKSVSL
ncbi:hypothetical protein BmR1_04g05320 [Babesia microti strain RI]|uniref:Uncharacterized protein n=1 Tax=Babesia microti (strain RI) TaxID=1133968 RepID=A0A1N6LXD2_BABMR|nr:hypothetical protein BmR1_04g05320 [Babesia microti strain RI]SIO73540.1 hypothetical protein BmR1_04g05320 [Babesia microti strain RI]|eukprot:XP_021337631.1 hypothetical protein BmR1_04g05320 [Babesia microti strain RI]